MSGPEPSPRPPENPPERTQTGEFRAVVEPMLDAHDRKMTLRGWITALVTAVSMTGLGVVTAIIFVDNRVAAQTAKSAEVVTEKHDALRARVETLEKRFDRFDAKMDLMLDAQRVPQSIRPPPLDGGK